MLYHREVFWLDNFDNDSLSLVKSANTLSNHLWEHLNSNSERRDFDLQGLYKVVNDLKHFNKIEPFEVETDEFGNVAKCAVRIDYNDKKDICIVFRSGVIVTAWLCNTTDKHYTLDTSKYVGF